MVDLPGVGAHYAITSLFDGFGEQNTIYCYDVDMLDSHVQQSGRAGVAVGRARIMSHITREQMPISFGVLHFGDHNLSAGVRRFRSENEYHEMAQAVSEAFGRADLPEALRVLDRHFEGTAYSLKSLFRDEQRRIVNRILQATLSEAEASYRQIYEHHAPLMRFLAGLVINGSLRRALEAPDLDLDEVRGLLDTATREKINLDVTGLEYALRRRLNALAGDFAADPGDVSLLVRIHAIVSMPWPFEINLWRVQNLFYSLLQTEYPARQEDPNWSEPFTRIVEKLKLRLPAPKAEQPAAA
jgi:hypothetical protein